MGDELDHDHTDIETLAGLYDCVRELVEERDWLKDELEAVRPQYEGHTRSLNGAIHDLEAERDRLRKVVRGSLIAIETILMGDHVDLGEGSGVILGRVSAALKHALVESEITDG